MRYKVECSINELAGTGKLLMSPRAAIIESDETLEDELIKDFKSKLSSLYKLPQNEIKFKSYSEL